MIEEKGWRAFRHHNGGEFWVREQPSIPGESAVALLRIARIERRAYKAIIELEFREAMGSC